MLFLLGGGGRKYNCKRGLRRVDRLSIFRIHHVKSQLDTEYHIKNWFSDFWFYTKQHRPFHDKSYFWCMEWN